MTNSSSVSSPKALEELLCYYLTDDYSRIEPVNHFISERFNVGHQDKDLPQLVNWYKSLYEENKELLGSFSTEDKAEILFRCYLRGRVEPIIDSIEYQAACDKLFKSFIEDTSNFEKTPPQDGLKTLSSIALKILRQYPYRYLRRTSSLLDKLALSNALNVGSDIISFSQKNAQKKLPEINYFVESTS
ncbi:hypothetical protein [Candidatus Neptunochlamydia vexilliferae]|uniref:hypothetical protein n=1 Tax=Candidatus Neptunichlamydia vexilliferae TaxID=1651774 RepID=UPI0018918842|nr:hypothetical protein [Candidatus Neptunochlamydia vexilliferae]